MTDPYLNVAPSIDRPAYNAFEITPDDANDLPAGVKSLRVANMGAAAQNLVVVTVMGETVTLPVPAGVVYTERLRVARVLTTTGADITVHDYTDVELP